MSEEHIHDENCDHDHDEEGLEVINVRLVGEELHCTLLAEAFEEPATWGTVLADIARNLAESCATEEVNTEQLLKAIRENFLEAITTYGTIEGVDLSKWQGSESQQKSTDDSGAASLAVSSGPPQGGKSPGKSPDDSITDAPNKKE